MTTAVLTDRERTAVQAYLRLLQTVRAAFDTSPVPPDPHRVGVPTATAPVRPAVPPAMPPLVPPSVLAEAELALRQAGLSGNEEAFFRLLHTWCPQQ